MPGAPASKAITVVASHAIATAAAMATNVLYANARRPSGELEETKSIFAASDS